MERDKIAFKCDGFLIKIGTKPVPTCKCSAFLSLNSQLNEASAWVPT